MEGRKGGDKERKRKRREKEKENERDSESEMKNKILIKKSEELRAFHSSSADFSEACEGSRD